MLRCDQLYHIQLSCIPPCLTDSPVSSCIIDHYCNKFTKPFRNMLRTLHAINGTAIYVASSAEPINPTVQVRGAWHKTVQDATILDHSHHLPSVPQLKHEVAAITC